MSPNSFYGVQIRDFISFAGSGIQASSQFRTWGSIAIYTIYVTRLDTGATYQFDDHSEIPEDYHIVPSSVHIFTAADVGKTILLNIVAG